MEREREGEKQGERDRENGREIEKEENKRGRGEREKRKREIRSSIQKNGSHLLEATVARTGPCQNPVLEMASGSPS